MITFSCPNCGKQLEVDDELAGGETTCECGKAAMVPVELKLDEEPVSGEARTMTLDEVKALKKPRR
jgi:hypothetical protein